jgi:hypothetical protein
MATSRPFAYNTGSAISGTTQVGSLAVGTPSSGFSSTGLAWWNGAVEECMEEWGLELKPEIN